MPKSEEKKHKHLRYIITNYEIARDKIDRSKEILAETSQELDEIITRYKTIYDLYDRYNPRPSGSFAELEEESLARLLISGCSNSEMIKEEVSGFKDSMIPLSAVVFKVLELLEGNPGVTSQNVSAALDVSVPNAGMALYRLYKQGLVDRKTQYLGIWRKPPFSYAINDRGTNRLEYYRAKALSG